MTRTVLAGVFMIGLAAATPQGQTYLPHRVFDTAARQFIDFEVMLAALAKADVVYVGEQHDDPNTHRLERAVLEGLAARRAGVILSLEMFERDVQQVVDQFASGALPEDRFLAASRPWPRYATDYKPLVDFAVSKGWPVVAANVPRPIASEIAKTGMSALDGKSEVERAWFAADRVCPTDDEYFKRFGEAMGSHPAMDTLKRYYESQCVKDETMAESIVRAWQAAAPTVAPARPLVVHYNGAFHSDFGLGTAARVTRRLPEASSIVVTMVPVKDIAALDAAKPEGDDLRRARFLVYTVGK